MLFHFAISSSLQQNSSQLPPLLCCVHFHFNINFECQVHSLYISATSTNEHIHLSFLLLLVHWVWPLQAHFKSGFHGTQVINLQGPVLLWTVNEYTGHTDLNGPALLNYKRHWHNWSCLAVNCMSTQLKGLNDPVSLNYKAHRLNWSCLVKCMSIQLKDLNDPVLLNYKGCILTWSCLALNCIWVYSSKT